MKNRFITLFMVGIFWSSSLFSQEEPIEMHKWNYDKRSIDFPLSMSHDGNTFYIYSDIPLSGLLIMIKDMNGNIVYSNYIFIDEGVRYTLPLELTSGSYMIDTGDYYGYFTL